VRHFNINSDNVSKVIISFYDIRDLNTLQQKLCAREQGTAQGTTPLKNCFITALG